MSDWQQKNSNLSPLEEYDFFQFSIDPGDRDEHRKIVKDRFLKMIENETISGGMIPKIQGCLDAINNGVTGVAIVDARTPHACLFEIFTDKGAGTLIRK